MSIIKKARVSADKRSIDVYGRSVELAIANYLLDNGDFPTDISELTIEYSGDRVECSIARLNSDSSVYLTGCTVAGRSVDYTYGRENGSQVYQAYSVGDEVTYNNINYYVIKDSDTTEDSVTLLKAEPITSAEISPYLSSTEVANKVDINGTYAAMSYYARDNCVSAGDTSGCSTDYLVSDIKQVVDIWKSKNFNDAIEARLIKLEELLNDLGYEDRNDGTIHPASNNYDTPGWVYLTGYYWTMSSYGDSENRILYISSIGDSFPGDVTNAYVIRLVITTKKSALEA